jgi:hypothetical protein
MSVSRREMERGRNGSQQWVGADMGNITETIEITRTVQMHYSDGESCLKEETPVVETTVVSHTGNPKQPVKSFYFV